jgi:hypothetical protein
MNVSLGSCGHVAYGSVRSVQLFRFDSEGRLSAELGNYQVRKSVDWLDHMAAPIYSGWWMPEGAELSKANPSVLHGDHV